MNATIVLEWKDEWTGRNLRLLTDGMHRASGFDVYRFEIRDQDSMNRERWTHDSKNIPINTFARVVENLVKEKAMLQGKLDAMSKVLEGKS